MGDRDQWIIAAQIERMRFMTSRLLRFRHTVFEPWSPGKMTHVFRALLSLLTPRRIQRRVRPIRQDPPAFPVEAIPGVVDERFDPAFYRAIYPDIDRSGSDPLEHFIAYGIAERRIGWLAMPRSLSELDRARPTALVVFHDGSRTGAPILGYNLVRRFLRDGNAVALFYRAGPVMAACEAAGAVVLGPEVWSGGSLPHGRILLRRIVEEIAPRFAILNSVESRHIARSLADLYVPTISLIHEFATDIRPRGAVTEAAFWSGETVFSANVVRENARSSDLALSDIDFPVIPQGRCELPEEGGNGYSSDDDAALLRRALRPPGFPSDGLVVIGVGSVIPRKGVDLFIECATRVREMAPDIPVRFVWIGSANPAVDPAYSAVLADQIQRADVSGGVAVIDEVPSLLTAYLSADVLMVSSRLDPLPNVAIDALSEGMPVLCFDHATGIADILKQNGLGDRCVASYLSPESMARKLIDLASSPELRERIGIESAQVAAATFDMDRYVSRLQELAIREGARAEQERRDAEIIARSELVQVGFHSPTEQSHEPYADTVRRYVRAWSAGIHRRKPFPGFHPGIYLEEHGVQRQGADPLADYICAGRPRGPWEFDLLTPGSVSPKVPRNLRIGLHIHVHYPDLLATMLKRLRQNQTRIDLLVSVTSEDAAEAARTQLVGYRAGSVEVRAVPNRGRDIAPLLTEFADTIVGNYDIVGHVHTKKTVEYSTLGEVWYRFLLENLLGGRARMADEILARMAAQPGVGIVFPDDPHVVGWTGNRAGAEALCARLQLGRLPENPVFPVGTMFWARVPALRPLFDLGLTWDDYPEEPLPYDGTILHVIERVLPMVATASGASILLSHVPGVTR